MSYVVCCKFIQQNCPYLQAEQMRVCSPRGQLSITVRNTRSQDDVHGGYTRVLQDGFNKVRFRGIISWGADVNWTLLNERTNTGLDIDRVSFGA